MPTLNAARELVGRLSQRGFVVNDSTTGSGGTASPATLVDGTRLADTTKGTDFYVRGWLLRTSLAATGVPGSDRARRIAAYDPASGTLTLTPAYSSGGAPVAGEPYEVWPTWDPREVEQAIIRVQRHMYGLNYATITPTSGQLQYPLTTTATWLTRKAQVAQIEVWTLDANGQATMSTLPTNRVRDYMGVTGGVAVLDVRGDPVATTDSLKVLAWTDFHSLSPLAIPTDSTAAPLDWLAWEAVYEMCTSPGRNLDDDLRKRAVQEVRRHREANTPTVPQPLFDEVPPWGYAGRGYL